MKPTPGNLSAREAARKERTLPGGSSFPAGVETPAEPPVVLEPPPDARSESVSDQEPSLARSESGPGEKDAGQAEAAAGTVTPAKANRRSGIARTLAKVGVWVALFPVLCILPIILALHTSISLYQEDGYDAWLSLSIGVLVAMLAICVAIVAFMLSFRIRRRFFMHFVNLWLAAILSYSGYALFHLSNTNAKTDEIRSYYTSLHPLLRVAVKNLSMADDQLVITDLHRTPDDYRLMGLPLRERSMHFKQPTGFVHAVDIRTKGRSKVKNLLVELYFVLMGFDTIRHVGTADHLHVSLPLRRSDSSSTAPGDEPD